MPHPKGKFIRNFIYLLSGDLVAKTLGFLAIIFIARKLGVEEFGRLGFAEAFFSYFIYIGIAGVDTIAVRDIARDKARTDINTYLGNVMSLKLILSVVAYISLIAIVLCLNIALPLKHLTLLYGLCLLPVALSTEWLFQGIEKMKYIGLFKILREATYIIGVLLILTITSSSYAIPIVRMIAMLVAVLFLFVVISNIGFKLGPRKDFVLWKSLLKQSHPILTSQLLVMIVYNCSIIILGLLDMPEEIGYFSAVQKIVLFFISMAGIFWAVAFPVVSSLFVESREKLSVFQEKLSKILCVISIPIGFIGFTLAGPILTFLYGDAYAKSIQVFRILIWVAMLAFLTGIFAQGLLATGKQHLFLRTVLIQTVISVGLAIYLIPRLGVVGAAIPWLLSEIVLFFINKRFYDRVVKFTFYRHLIKPVLASLLIVLALNYFDSLKTITAVPLCIVVYFIIMLIIKGIEVSELKFIYQSVVGK